MLQANPYAAPQTLESSLDGRKLPTATLASSGALRKELPTVSTKALARLVRHSRALDDMQVVWLWLTPLLLLGIFLGRCVSDLGQLPEPLDYKPLALGAGICLARLVLGHRRAVVSRYVGLLLDGVLVAACVAAMTLLMKRWFFGSFAEQVALVLGSAMLFFPVLFGYQALVAMLEARELFGARRCQHLELVEELGYRRELGIE